MEQSNPASDESKESSCSSLEMSVSGPIEFPDKLETPSDDDVVILEDVVEKSGGSCRMRVSLPQIFRCRLCGLELSTKCDVQRHCAEVHASVDKAGRWYRCDGCPKSFPTGQQLTQHQLVHTNVRRYKCEFCDKAFKQLSHLQQHKRIHTGEMPYRCGEDGCGKAFRQLASLKQHIKGHTGHSTFFPRQQAVGRTKRPTATVAQPEMLPSPAPYVLTTADYTITIVESNNSSDDDNGARSPSLGTSDAETPVSPLLLPMPDLSRIKTSTPPRLTIAERDNASLTRETVAAQSETLVSTRKTLVSTRKTLVSTRKTLVSTHETLVSTRKTPVPQIQQSLTDLSAKLGAIVWREQNLRVSAERMCGGGGANSTTVMPCSPDFNNHSHN